MGINFNPFGDSLSRLASDAADDYGVPDEKEIERTFTLADFKEIKNIFRDEHGRIKVIFAGAISVVIVIIGAWLTVSPPKDMPQACKENGPSLLIAGGSLLGGFIFGKV
jgi:hypothetical protein